MGSADLSLFTSLVFVQDTSTVVVFVWCVVPVIHALPAPDVTLSGIVRGGAAAPTAPYNYFVVCIIPERASAGVALTRCLPSSYPPTRILR
jgi:hypothetical protein